MDIKTNSYPSNKLYSVEYKDEGTQTNMTFEQNLRLQKLQILLDGHIVACDGLISLFVAAATSYRYDEVLIPCPPSYIKKLNEIDIDELTAVIQEIPNLQVLLQNLVDKDYDQINDTVFNLLYWLIKSQSEIYLTLMNECHTLEVLKRISLTRRVPKPTQLFEVWPKTNSKTESRFLTRSTNYARQYAFYYNRLDVFYRSIMNGFCLEDGVPLTLTTDLLKCLNQSQLTACWGHSLCGSMICCVALCEIAMDPDFVDCNVSSIDNLKIKQFIVRDPDLVRVRYLFFYGQRLTKWPLPKKCDILYPYENITDYSYLLGIAGITILLVYKGASMLRASKWAETTVNWLKTVFGKYL